MTQMFERRRKKTRRDAFNASAPEQANKMFDKLPVENKVLAIKAPNINQTQI